MSEPLTVERVRPSRSSVICALLWIHWSLTRAELAALLDSVGFGAPNYAALTRQLVYMRQRGLIARSSRGTYRLNVGGPA